MSHPTSGNHLAASPSPRPPYLADLGHGNVVKKPSANQRLAPKELFSSEDPCSKSATLHDQRARKEDISHKQVIADLVGDTAWGVASRVSGFPQIQAFIWNGANGNMGYDILH
jgi:hypothetical protein